MDPFGASVLLGTADAHVKSQPSRVPHLSALMVALVDRPVTTPMNALAYQGLRDTTVRIMWMIVQATSV